MGFGAAGGIVGPTLAGFVFDTLGNYQIVWSWFSGCVFLAIFLVIMMGDAPVPSGSITAVPGQPGGNKKDLTN